VNLRPWPVFLLLVAAAVAGCNSDSARDEINSQNQADYNAKSSELNDVVGTWCGVVYLKSQDQNFDCQLTLLLNPVDEKSDEPDAPSETVRIAALGGNITFPALVASVDLPLQDYEGLEPLRSPMDDNAIATISLGDYQRSDRSFALPYLGSNGSSTFGNFSGSMSADGNQLTGTWSANNFGTVGTFVLKRSSRGTCQW
jgi:hypothetical protein